MIAFVPTCNRPELFQRLVTRLDGFRVTGFVNNSTPENIIKYAELDLPKNVNLIFTEIKGEPKASYVRTFRFMLQQVNRECIIIQDDCYPCDNFYNELLQRINILKKHTLKNFILSPMYLPNRNSDRYTGGVSRKIKVNGYEFIDQAWVDGNFYMTAEVCLAMKKWLQPPVKVYQSSSGIGRRNSIEIYKRKWKMFTAVPTLVEHLDQESVMFGERRKDVPLISRFQ